MARISDFSRGNLQDKKKLKERETQVGGKYDEKWKPNRGERAKKRNKKLTVLSGGARERSGQGSGSSLSGMT